MDPNVPVQPMTPSTPQVPIQPMPETPPIQPNPVMPPAPKKVSGVLIAGLILLFISVLALVGYYFIQTKGLNVNISTPTPLVTIAPTPTATPDPTADWKTYTDSAKTYTFKYPSDWTPSTDVGLFNNPNKDWIFGVEISSSSLSAQEWVSSKRCTSDILGKLCSIETTSPILNSIQFTNFGSQYTEIGTVIKHGASIFEINLNARNPNQPVDDNTKNTYAQILSTFKFTEVSPSPSSTPSSTPSATPAATPI